MNNLYNVSGVGIPRWSSLFISIFIQCIHQTIYTSVTTFSQSDMRVANKYGTMQYGGKWLINLIAEQLRNDIWFISAIQI